MSFVEKILDLIEKHLPWFLGGYAAGKSSNRNDTSRLMSEIIKLKLHIKKARYEQKIKERNSKLTNSELANEINGKGRKKE